MRFLVTGGAGFVGSHIVDRLISEEHEVVVIDNLLTGSRHNVNPKAIFYQLDIVDFEKLEEVFNKHKFDYIFHVAAGYLVQSIENPQRDLMINGIGTLNICQLSLKYKIKKIVYSNSGGASYGEPKKLPLTEDHSILPLNPYGASKFIGELYLYMYHKNYGLNYTSLRYGNVYGPRQNPKLEGGVVSVFLDSFLKGERPIMRSDGTPTRDYVFVEDVVDANMLALKKGGPDGYHVATGIEISVYDLISLMQKVLNTSLNVVKGPPRIGDIQRAVFDISKIKNELGWAPKTSLEDGLRQTADWQKKVQEGIIKI